MNEAQHERDRVYQIIKKSIPKTSAIEREEMVWGRFSAHFLHFCDFTPHCYLPTRGWLLVLLHMEHSLLILTNPRLSDHVVEAVDAARATEPSEFCGSNDWYTD
jgi:hypothetical protein